MSSALVCVLGLIWFALAYRFYSSWLARRVFVLDDTRPTPAHTLEDGVDFVPTPRWVLFGHHFSSIAGAAPIVGPAVAVIWGWVPAVLWIALGVVFAGAMHDMGALVVSARHRGRTIGEVSAELISPRARTLFLLIIFFLTTMVLAVFAYVIASLFVKFPGSVLPINIEIPIAMAVGWLAYKRRAPLLLPSIVVLVVGYALTWVGADLAGPTEAWAARWLGPTPQDQIFAWCLLLLAYSFVASVLPVWILLQPRDFVNSHKLAVGLGGLVLGLFVVHPPIVAPAFNTPASTPSWFPLLFITIACGAVSGFHGLVSSGTSSKQLTRESDARAIGYGAMLGEGALALIATLAVTAGFPSAEAWHDHYGSWGAAQGLNTSLAAFVTGSATFLGGLGIRAEVAQVIVAVLVISFAATSLDTATRIQRFVVQELAAGVGLRPLENRYVAGLFAVGTALFMLLAASPAGPGSGGLVLWPIFGAGNQLLAALTLLVLVLWLRREGRPVAVALVPMLFLGVMTTVGMGLNLARFLEEGNLLLAPVTGLILLLALGIFAEGLRAWGAGRARAG